MEDRKPRGSAAAENTCRDVEQYLVRLARAVGLNLPQASRYTGLDMRALHKAIASGELKTYTFQRQIVATVRDLRRLKGARGATKD